VALRQQKVAAAIIIPSEFDEKINQASASIELYLNNVTDTDLADDIRREITRTLAELDAPQLGIAGERFGPSEGILLQNPFRVAIAERDLRETDVSFFQYQMIPIVVLLVLSAGLLGTAMLASRDFQRRTAKVLVLSPQPRGVLIAGKLLGGVAITLSFVVPAVAILALAGFMTPPPGHWGAMIALLLALVTLAVGLGLLLGIYVRNDRWVGMIGLNLAAYLFFLGGGFSTVAFLPEWLQKASLFVPTSYAVAGLRQALFYPDLVGFARDLTAVSASAIAAALLATVALARKWRHA
jgi:ABC-type multidrug transport system permease subunit